MIRLLEYEVLYKAAIDSGYPFDFKAILRENGFDISDISFGGNPAYIEWSTEGTISDDFKIEDCASISTDGGSFDEYVKDASAYVDIESLKNLNIFPIWLSEIEEAVHTNIHNFAVYNENMYNKKLEGMYGGIDLKPPAKNLIIIDISGSIPRAVSSTCLTLAKNLAETFYADLMITGSKSTLYSYEDINNLDVNTIYNENGMDNDQVYFKRLLTADTRHYNTAIVFGDNDEPGRAWGNKFNRKTRSISNEDGKELCQWKVENLISFHTDSTSHKGCIIRTAGYARWFTPDNTEHIKDWVKYLK